MSTFDGGSTGANVVAGIAGSINTDTSTHVVDASMATASAQTAYAPTLSASSGGMVSYSGSDFGAISAASSIISMAEQLVAQGAADSQVTARMAIGDAGATVRQQGAGALALITKPFLIFVALLLVAWWILAGRKKRKDK